MKFKVCCEITFPKYEVILDVNIPINKSVYYVCEMLNELIVEKIDKDYQSSNLVLLINKRTGIPYDKNALVKETDIKNGSKLVYY